MGHLQRRANNSDKNQYQSLDGRRVRLVPVKVHVLNGLQAAIERNIKIRAVLCDGLIVETSVRSDVDAIVKRAAFIHAFPGEKWRLDKWKRTLDTAALDKLMTHKPAMFNKSNQTRTLD